MQLEINKEDFRKDFLAGLPYKKLRDKYHLSGDKKSSRYLNNVLKDLGLHGRQTNAFLTKLTEKAELYWKEQKTPPTRMSLNWLLIPAYGNEITGHLLIAKVYLKDKNLQEILLNEI